VPPDLNSPELVAPEPRSLRSIAEPKQVREVSLLGTAEFGFWCDDLKAEGLATVRCDEAAQVNDLQPSRRLDGGGSAQSRRAQPTPIAHPDPLPWGEGTFVAALHPAIYHDPFAELDAHNSGGCRISRVSRSLRTRASVSPFANSRAAAKGAGQIR
jgi:hypothetical protein